MRSKGRILFGLALGFLVPLLWLGFRTLFFDESTVTSASFERREDWFDGAATALLGWMVGSIFAGGFSLQALGDLFSDPSKRLQPAISNLVGSRLWHGVGLLVLSIEILGVVQLVPRRLPDVTVGGFAWYHSSRGEIAEDASAQRRALGRIGAYLKSGATDTAGRQVPLATVSSPSRFGRLETDFIEVTVRNDKSAGCASLGAGPIPVNQLLDDPCLAGSRVELAAAIAAGMPKTFSRGKLDLDIAPGATPVLTIKKAGVVANQELDSLLATWLGQALLTQRDERQALDETAALLGTESLTGELVDRAVESLLPSGPAWALPAAIKAGRLSSLLRLIYSCRTCSPAAISRLLDRLVDPVRAKLVKSGPKNRVLLADVELAHDWARIAAWWAEERKDSKMLHVALATLDLCGAEVHRTLLEHLGNAASDYLEPETRAVLRMRVARYSKSSEAFCEAVVAKAQVENLALRSLVTEWMTEAAKNHTSCDLRTVLYGAAGGAP